MTTAAATATTVIAPGTSHDARRSGPPPRGASRRRRPGSRHARASVDRGGVATPHSRRRPARSASLVHHVASVYPIEIELAQRVASRMAIVGVTMADIHAMNAAHAAEFVNVSRLDALTLLRRTSAQAAAAIGMFIGQRPRHRHVGFAVRRCAGHRAVRARGTTPCGTRYHHLAAIRQAVGAAR